MNYSVADALASVGGNTETDISAILPYGIAPGAKAVMRKEKKAAEEAISTGTYVIWRSMKTGLDCARVGSMSRCFCGCSYEMHAFRKGFTPEEIGEWWLPRRPGFDASSWRAKCRCGHSHEAHHPSRRSCGSCKCGEFYSAYGCVVCESHQEDHQTQVESAQERIDAGRPVGRDFIPLSQSPQLSQLTFGRKNKRSSGEGPSSKPKATDLAAALEGDGGNASLKSGTRLGLPTPSHRMNNIGLFSEPKNLTMTVSSVRASQISRSTAIASPNHGQQQNQRYMGRPTLSPGASARVDHSTDGTSNAHCGGDLTSPNPELLYGSGRITASRYHEMLAEMDGRATGDNEEGRKGSGPADTAARMAAVPSGRNVAGARRRESRGLARLNPPQQERSDAETYQKRYVVGGMGRSRR